LTDVRIVSCVHALRCPGCALIGLDYAAQVATKRRRLDRAVRRYPALERTSIDDVIAAQRVTDYRLRSKLAVACARVGAYAGPGHEVVDIPECRVLSPPIARSVAALRQLLAEPPAGTEAVLAALTAVDLRAANTPEGSRVLLTLVIDRERAGTRAEHETLGEHLLAACPDLAGVAVSFGRAQGPQQLGSEPVAVAGRSELLDQAEGAELIALPGAFSQVHRDQADWIAREISLRLGRVLGSLAGARVLDLYGGSGALGLALAARGANVTIVESYRPAADAARRAGARFGDRVQVVAEDAGRFLSAEPGDWQAVVVNPPRRGIAPAVRERLARIKPRAIAYVSCNPETLARDLAHLSLLGLSAARAVPIDMMPLTEEVETLALLEPASPPAPRVIAEDDQLLVVDKPAHEPTLGETGSLLARVRALAGCGAASPLSRLGRSASGVCVFAKSPLASVRCAPPSAAWITRWVLLARGAAKLRGAPRHRRLETVGGHSLIELEFSSGAPRLARRLATIGRPVVGDAQHGHPPTNRHFGELHGLDRAFLHCARVEIETTMGGARAFEAPLAGDLEAVLEGAAGRMPGSERVNRDPA
jgi:23S rRNA (uracil1939-C5)-methyltransferase